MLRISLMMFCFLALSACKKETPSVTVDGGSDLSFDVPDVEKGEKDMARVDLSPDLPVSACQPNFDGEVGARQLSEGLYVVHSGLTNSDLETVQETSNIFVFGPDDAGGFWIVGSGYGSASEEVTAYGLGPLQETRSAQTDVSEVVHILTNCLAAEPGVSPINFVAPHAHYDHINAEFFSELDLAGFTLENLTIFIHENDFRPATCNAPCCRQMPCDETSGSYGVPFAPMWQDEQLGRFRTIGSRMDVCGDKILDIDVGDFGVWEVYYSPGHTPGSINLVNRSQSILITGSPEDEFECRAQTDLTWWPIHGTVPLN